MEFGSLKSLKTHRKIKKITRRLARFPDPLPKASGSGNPATNRTCLLLANMHPGQLEIANLLSEVIVVSQLCMALTLACMHEERGTYDRRSSACLELVTTVVYYLKTPCTAVLNEYCSCKLLQNIPSTRNGRSMRSASHPAADGDRKSILKGGQLHILPSSTL